jgi:hypothetical protein
MSDVLQAVGVGVLVAGVGAWGAFGPEKFNPLALKAKYRRHVSPGFAKGLRVALGCALMLVGVAVVAIGLSEFAK